MPVIDLHCDTLTYCRENGLALTNPKTQLSLDRMDAPGGWCQAFAIFIPDEYRGREATNYFEANYRFYLEELEHHRDRLVPVYSFADMEKAFVKGKIGSLLAVEGGAVLRGDPKRVAWLAGLGVRMLTLTWNGANELAGGCGDDSGLTEAGREMIPLLERSGIILDVSHLGDNAFAEFLAFAQRPFVASHSNSREICDHRRNLTDVQFRAIADRGGLVGLNFCPHFLGDKEEATLEQLIRHIRHFEALGGADILAMGSDFDGTDMPDFVSGSEKLARLGGSMVKSGLSEDLAEKILWRNARDFFKRYGL